MSEPLTLAGTTLHPGRAEGELLVLDEPLSFWGGTDATGRIIDQHHPQRGALLAGRVVAMTSGRGSSSSSSVLAEAIRTSAAPAALLLAEPDAIIVLAAIVAAELYGRHLPVVLLDRFESLVRSGHAVVDAGERAATLTLVR